MLVPTMALLRHSVPGVSPPPAFDRSCGEMAVKRRNLPVLYWQHSVVPAARSLMSAAITERELVAACRETLARWPQARAAVLFGSRARGTQRPDSDWDIAFVLEGSDLRHPRPARSVFPRSQMPVDLDRVDAWALSEDDLHRNARALGTLPYVVCRDGRVLAGEWNGPNPAFMEGDAVMKPEDWASRMRQVVVQVSSSMTPISFMAASGTWTGSGEDCANLLRNTADAAELLVKAAMERRGVPTDRSHDIVRLAADFAAQRPDESALAERMTALNGTTRRDHVAMYLFSPPEVADVQAALERLAATLDLLASEIEAQADGMAGQIPGLARFAAGRAGMWLDLVHTPVTPRSNEDHPAQAAAEAALGGRSALAGAITSFQGRVQRVVEAAGPVDDPPDPTPFD